MISQLCMKPCERHDLQLNVNSIMHREISARNVKEIKVIIKVPKNSSQVRVSSFHITFYRYWRKQKEMVVSGDAKLQTWYTVHDKCGSVYVEIFWFLATEQNNTSFSYLKSFFYLCEHPLVIKTLKCLWTCVVQDWFSPTLSGNMLLRCTWKLRVCMLLTFQAL